MRTDDHSPPAPKLPANLIGKIRDAIFSKVHGQTLIYNACWEDPRIDRQLMKLDADSRVVMLTSAGCNALDYALDGPAEIHCVDMNPRQNALLELKLALLRRESHAELFALFGRGGSPEAPAILARTLNALPEFARDFWKDRLDWFSPKTRRGSFYYRGAAGTAAYFARKLLGGGRRRSNALRRLADARSLDEQRLAFRELEPALTSGLFAWLSRRSGFMSLLGVPQAQVQLISGSHPGGMAGFLADALRHVLTDLPMRENYFWRAYLTGGYLPDNCPEYLRPENFERLRASVDSIRSWTGTISDYLRQSDGQFTHFVLLDHQDWMAGRAPALLEEEWRLILEKAAPGAKILFRSAGPDADFLPGWVRERVRFEEGETRRLHAQDRVGTYGSLHFGMVSGALTPDMEGAPA